MKNFCILLIALFLAKGAMAQWVLQNSGTTKNLYSVHFPDSNTGYACGDSGIILKTTNGGEEWNVLNPGNYQLFQSVYFIDADTGYVVGRGGLGTAYILKTYDGGMNWSPVFSHKEFIGSWLTSVYFPNAATGYAVGYSMFNTMGTRPFIARTENCGWNWTVNSGVPGDRLNSVCFTSPDTGYTVGSWGPSGMILKTTNGGEGWIMTGYSIPWVSVNLISICFPDTDTGYTAGGVFLKTTDGGTQWTDLNNASGYAVSFTDTRTGYLVGGSGVIQKTTDGAATWMTLNSGISSLLRSVFFTGVDTGYTVGTGGRILKTTNGGGFPVGTEENTKYQIRITNFPNPAGQTTTFSYTLDDAGPVSIQIFSSFGQLVAEPLNANQSKGDHQMTWDAGKLPDGIYFYRLKAGKEVGGGKMVVDLN